MEKLGIEPKLLLTQIVNFVIMVAILTKFLYKPIIKTLNTRKSQISKLDQDQQNLIKDREKLDFLKEDILDKAQLEARAILDQVQKEADILKTEIINDGHQEILLLKQKLEVGMTNKLAEAKKEFAGQTIAVSLEIIKKLLPEVLSKKNRQEYITKQLAKLHKIYAV